MPEKVTQPPGPEKIFVVITVARQVEGEYIFIKTEKGFRKASEADGLLKKLKESFTENGKAKPVELSTPNGKAACVCEVRTFEIDVE